MKEKIMADAKVDEMVDTKDHCSAAWSVYQMAVRLGYSTADELARWTDACWECYWARNLAYMKVVSKVAEMA